MLKGKAQYTKNKEMRLLGEQLLLTKPSLWNALLHGHVLAKRWALSQLPRAKPQILFRTYYVMCCFTKESEAHFVGLQAPITSTYFYKSKHLWEVKLIVIFYRVVFTLVFFVQILTNAPVPGGTFPNSLIEDNVKFCTIDHQ